MGKQESKRSEDRRGLGCEVSKGTRFLPEAVQSQSGYILAKSMTSFCPCLENLSETEFKGNELMC